jgi:AraC-like DNA-binding protein/tetratricopeptide (TPR) repeat protein
MTEHDEKELLAQAAQPTLELIEAYLEQVSERLRPVLDVLLTALFDKKLDVNTLWRRSKVTSNQASEWFRSEMKYTPLRFLVHCRMRVALLLLVDTRLKLGPIAILLGYPNSDSFGKRFTKWAQVTPGKFRLHPDPRVVEEARQNRPDLLTVKTNEDPSLSRQAPRRQAPRQGDSSWPTFQIVPLRFDDDTSFIGSFCALCRRNFYSDDGQTVVNHLHDVLAPFPYDLPWLRGCCDPCYRVVTDSVERGRLGLINDAWIAWFFVENTHTLDSPETPPSPARVLRFLWESEKLIFSQPERRLELCRRATEIALEVGVPGLTLMALLYEGNSLRALTRYDEGRQKLNQVRQLGWQGIHGEKWIAAAYYHRLGTLESDVEDYRAAIPALKTAADRYRDLDRHLASSCEFKLAEALYWSGQFEEALETFDVSVVGLDFRRFPQLASIIAINRGLYLCALGRLDEAEEELRKFESDQPSLIASHEHTVGCLKVEQERPVEALVHLGEAETFYREHGKIEEVAQVILYRVECHTQVKNFRLASQELETAIELFATTSRHARVLQGLQQLQGILRRSPTVDATVVKIRRAAWASGGRLPLTPRLKGASQAALAVFDR